VAAAPVARVSRDADFFLVDGSVDVAHVLATGDLGPADGLGLATPLAPEVRDILVRLFFGA